MNKVTLIGRVGRDAELKTIGNGTMINFSLATSEKYTAKDGTRKENTEWHNCTMWGDRVTKIAQYITKGKQLAVNGSIHYREVEQDGKKLRYTDINVSDVEFIGNNNTQSNGTATDGYMPF